MSDQPDTPTRRGEQAADLAFRARALAQSHPLSPSAAVSLRALVDEERRSLPIAAIADWAAAAVVTGYCLRRVEEAVAGPVPIDGGRAIDGELVERIASGLRLGEAQQWLLGDEDVTLAALDRIIASEIEKRHDSWRSSVDAAGWAEMEQYLAWWVVEGYATRAAEMARLP